MTFHDLLVSVLYLREKGILGGNVYEIFWEDGSVLE
jgi:hypothetical protein